MSKYDAVRNLIDLVRKDDGYFDFSHSQHCMVAKGVSAGVISLNHKEGTIESIAESLGISHTQAYDIYCGHLAIYYNTVDSSSQASIDAHYNLMRDKDFCINYVLSLIETWEAIDTVSSDKLPKRIEGYNPTYAILDEASCDA